MASPKVPAWLRDAVFYQIYPQSFYDTNNDGIGDLPGIIARLDYIKSLGVTALWINPCFVSPFQDAGYDVADYYRIAPRYGTNEDMKRLFEEARKRGIRVCLDLVPGHTSIDHPWFKASCEATPNEYTNRFVWTQNVWQSHPKLRTISGYSDRDGAYITNFFYCQPALNFGFAKPDPKHPWQMPVDHPDCLATREAMLDIMRYWLDMGASGFRVDMAPSLVKQDPGHKATIALWRSVREILDREYPEAVIISEWSFPLQALRAGFHVDFMLIWGDPAYASLFRKNDAWIPERTQCFFDPEGGGDICEFTRGYMKHYSGTKRRGYIALPTSNHDFARLRRGRSLHEMKLAMAMLLTVPGVPFIYYGDEIGMNFVEGLTSKEGGFIRTGTRTPMQWDTTKNAGFSKAPAKDLYLPIDPDAERPTVAKQEKDPDSLLNFVRKLTGLRHAHPALGADGDFKPLYAEEKKYPFVYLRSLGNQRVVVALNPCAKPVKVTVPVDFAIGDLTELAGHECAVQKQGKSLKFTMAGLSFGIYLV